MAYYADGLSYYMDRRGTVNCVLGLNIILYLVNVLQERLASLNSSIYLGLYNHFIKPYTLRATSWCISTMSSLT
jgi:heme O synthase-like polyprenyltransferase